MDFKALVRQCLTETHSKKSRDFSKLTFFIWKMTKKCKNPRIVHLRNIKRHYLTKHYSNPKLYFISSINLSANNPIRRDIDQQVVKMMQ